MKTIAGPLHVFGMWEVPLISLLKAMAAFSASAVFCSWCHLLSSVPDVISLLVFRCLKDIFPVILSSTLCAYWALADRPTASLFICTFIEKRLFIQPVMLCRIISRETLQGGAVTFACKSSWQDWQDWYIYKLLLGESNKGVFLARLYSICWNYMATVNGHHTKTNGRYILNL